MRKIIILWATCRPITFLKTHSEWISTADSKANIVTKVAVDDEAQAKMLPGFEVTITGNTKAGVCYPCHCLSSVLKAEADDIVIFASDDFFPPKGWDTELLKRIPVGKSCVLVVNDGIQKYPNKVVTIPIMNFSALRAMNGYIYNPAYSHMWSDVELYEVAEGLGILSDIRKTDKFEMDHRHYCRGKRVKDEKDMLVDDKYREDKKIYEARKTLPVEKRICDDPEVLKAVSITKTVFKKPLLSLMICSIDSRKELLKRLLECLEKQMEFGVEILVEQDNGKLKIGKKRNLLLQRAKGEYCCFIDDDDLVCHNYIKSILKAIESNPDCCSLTGEMTTNGKNPVTFIHSLKYDSWFDEVNEEGKRIYYRCPNHLNVIKTAICKKVGFNNHMNVGEDKDFSVRVHPLLKTEVEIQDTLYFYLFTCNVPKQIVIEKPKESVVIKQVVPEKKQPVPCKRNFVIYAPWRI
jgi:cellulose synthase/poly-beta-1,6-N-acetylglucosamine synthase-like glycosyltransferase